MWNPKRGQLRPIDERHNDGVCDSERQPYAGTDTNPGPNPGPNTDASSADGASARRAERL